MNLKEWQAELELVVSTVERMEQSFQTADEQSKRHVCLAINQLMQQESKLEYIIQHFRSFQKARKLLSGKQKKLLIWIQDLAENSLDLYRKTVTFINQCSWLQSSYTLLTYDTKAEHWLLNQQQLHEMKKNYESLEKKRELLRRQLAELQKTKQELNNQYQTYTIERANFEASRSLHQEWGINPSNALRHPLLREIKQLFYHINLQSNSCRSASSQFRHLSGVFLDESRGLMQQAKRILEQNDRQTSPIVRKKTLKSLEAKLQAIAILEKKLDKLSLSLIKSAVSPVPVVVKKFHLQGRAISG